jgi:hypothetical protein
MKPSRATEEEKKGNKVEKKKTKFFEGTKALLPAIPIPVDFLRSRMMIFPS